MMADSNFLVNHLHPEDSARLLDEFNVQVATRGGTLKYRFLCKQGHYVWIHDSHRLIESGYSDEPEIVGSWTDITEQQNLARRLLYQATHDSLTGLVNRLEFEKRLANFLVVAREKK